MRLEVFEVSALELHSNAVVLWAKYQINIWRQRGIGHQLLSARNNLITFPFFR